MSFKNAKACFAENVNDLPQPSRFGKMEKADGQMWNLNKGLHSLTVAIEERFAEMESRIRHLEQTQQRSK